MCTEACLAFPSGLAPLLPSAVPVHLSTCLRYPENSLTVPLHFVASPSLHLVNHHGCQTQAPDLPQPEVATAAPPFYRGIPADIYAQLQVTVNHDPPAEDVTLQGLYNGFKVCALALTQAPRAAPT